MTIKTGAHSVYDLHVHLVFVTKYRRNVLSVLAIADLCRIFTNVCAKFEATLIECDGEEDTFAAFQSEFIDFENQIRANRTNYPFLEGVINLFKASLERIASLMAISPSDGTDPKIDKKPLRAKFMDFYS